MKKRILLWLAAAAMCSSALVATPPQATVTAPNGLEKLVIGSEYAITWNCSNCTASTYLIVEIYNTIHSGPGWSGQISPAGVPMNQGYFKWLKVGKLKDGTFLKPGPGYKIHLEAMDGSDASDRTFSLGYKPLIRKIRNH